MELFSTKCFEGYFKGETYEIHRFYVPDIISERLKFLRKYFNVMDREQIPHRFKRRKCGLEYAETAVMILARVDQLCNMDVPLAVGSKYLSPEPWATFGEVPDHPCLLNFRDFDDIGQYYYKQFCQSSSSIATYRFRIAPNLVESLSIRHKASPHMVMAIASCLLSDILLHAGPDCTEMFDLFTNDLREGPDQIKIDKWLNLRCKIMGRYGQIKDKPYTVKVGQLYHPPVKLVSETRIDLITDSDELSAGEKTVAVRMPRFINTEIGDFYDDGSVALESDVAYCNRVADRAAKHPHLFQDSFCQ